MKSSALVLVAALVTTGSAFAQAPQTKVETTEVEIVYVHGNNVVFLMNGKAVQRDVPADFKVNVDGQMVPVSELQPGQKVKLERTTTVTALPGKQVVTLRNAEVVNVSGQTLVYREGGKNKKITVPTDFKFVMDGKKVAPQDLTPGTKLNATFVTEVGQAPVVKQKLVASSTAPKAKEEPKPAVIAAPAPAAAPVAAAPAPAPAAPAPAPEPAKPAKKLPKTGSPFPLVGLSGGVLLALGAGLSTLRRRLA